MAFCDTSWKSTDASHETSILRWVRKKTRRSTSILKLQSVKCREIWHKMLILMPQHVSSRVAASLVPSQCLWGKLQNLSLSNVSKQGCNVVLRSSVAGVALRDIPTCFKPCQESFCVAGLLLLRRFQTMPCVFRGRRSTFKTSVRCHFAWQAQNFRRVVLRVFCKLHCQRCAKWWQGANSVAGMAFCDMWWKIDESHTLHFTLHTLIRSTLHTLHSTLWTSQNFHSTLHTLHSWLYTPHTLHSTLYTSHSTLYTAHFTLYTPHFTIHTPHSTPHTLHSTL